MQKKRVRRKSDETKNENKDGAVTGRKNELIGVGLAALGIVFLCGIFGFNVGFVGIYFAKFLEYFFGIGSIVPAVFLIYLGYHYIMEGGAIPLNKRSVGAILLYVLLLAVIHHFSVPAGEEILPSSLLHSGGLLGGIVLLIVRKLFGVTGGIVILGAGITGSVLLSTTWSLAKGIFTTQKKVEQGAEAAKEKATVVYEKAKVVEAKVQEHVVEQARQIKDNITTMHDNWQTRREREKSFFNQDKAEYIGQHDTEVTAGDAYKGSMSEGIGRDNMTADIEGKGFGDREEKPSITRGYTVDTAGMVLDENGKPRKDNVWGISSNPGKIIADMEEKRVLAEAKAHEEAAETADEFESQEAEAADNQEIIDENHFEFNNLFSEESETTDIDNEEPSDGLDEADVSDMQVNSNYFQFDSGVDFGADNAADEVLTDEVNEENASDYDLPVVDPYEENGNVDPYDEELTVGDSASNVDDIDETADDEIDAGEDDYDDEFVDEGESEEDFEPFQSFGTSSKGKSWFDDIDDDFPVDESEDDVLAVGSIGSTIAAGTIGAVAAKTAVAGAAMGTGAGAANAALSSGITASLTSNRKSSVSFDDEYLDEDFEEENAEAFADTSNLVENDNFEEAEEIEEVPYIMPDIHELLDTVEKADMSAIREEIEEKAQVLSQTLKDFNVKANILSASRGPSVTQYEVKPAPGVKVNKITNLSDEIALNMAASSVRIEIIPGKAAIGIEVPNTIRDSIPLREVLESPDFEAAKSRLTVGLGKDISGKAIFGDLAKMPHLLVAGATGSGKSVCINTLICSILFKAHPDEVKFILVDPKMVELSVYNDIPHLMVPVVTDAKKAASVLNWSVQEMERRYGLMSEAGVRNMDGYNRQMADEPDKQLCSIVIIIDELADLMMVAPHDVEDAICRIAQKARAAGIYMVLATQRPSVNVITGTIKANIPSRISFAVTSQIDSRTILDTAGAEKLLGKGDMLYAPYGSNKPTRVQGAFISDDEVERLVDFIKSQGCKAEANQEIIEFTERAAQEIESEDEQSKGAGNGGKKAKPKRRNKSDALMGEALDLILTTGQASASNVQRRFRIGFSTAQRIIDNMEELGILGPAMGSKPREILVTGDEARAILEEWDEE